MRLATTSIPIVITVTGDPVASGLAKSTARPGGNITGLTTRAADLGPKLLELVAGVVPKMSRIGVLLHPDSAGHPPQLMSIMSAAQKVGIQTLLAHARTTQEFEREFAMLARERARAAIILDDIFFVENAQHIAALALKNKVPLISASIPIARAGGLMSYGPDSLDNFRSAAGDFAGSAGVFPRLLRFREVSSIKRLNPLERTFLGFSAKSFDSTIFSVGLCTQR